MNFKGYLSLRQIKLVLLSLTVSLVILTFQYQIKIVSILRKDTKAIIVNTSKTTLSSFRDFGYEINRVKGIYIRKSTEVKSDPTIKTTNNPHSKEICSHNKCGNVSKTSTKHCSQYLATIRDDVYAIKNENMCLDRGGAKEIIVLVHSSTNNFERRAAIRQTWGNLTLLDSYNLRVAFILGQSANKSLQSQINHEDALHGDIVQGKFLDTYHNLSQKHVLGLRWVSEYCKTAKFVVKVDDDVFLNPFGFFRDLVTKFSNLTRTIMCNVRLNGTDRIQHGGKWGVNVNKFKNLTNWPFNFCQGFVVIYTSDIVPKIYKAATSNCTPFVWLDDVYVTGILAGNVGNISHSGLKRISQHVIYIHKELKTSMNQHWSFVLKLEKQLRIRSKKDAKSK